VKTVVEICAMQTIVQIVKNKLKWDKDALKPERKQSWSKKTTWDKKRSKLKKPNFFNQLPVKNTND